MLLWRPQIFEDAYKSQLSCVVVDDIERLLGNNTSPSVDDVGGTESDCFCVDTVFVYEWEDFSTVSMSPLSTQ